MSIFHTAGPARDVDPVRIEQGHQDPGVLSAYRDDMHIASAVRTGRIDQWLIVLADTPEADVHRDEHGYTTVESETAARALLADLAARWTS